jgi:CheY-like chemotaxis protein
MKVLVVDDEEDIGSLFRQKFRKEIKTGQFDLLFFLSGEEVIEYLNENGYEDKLILSDINMPGINGLELLYYIRKQHRPPTPVIFMITAYGDQDNKKRARSLGANEFLTKPLDFDKLKEKMKESMP